MIPPCNDRRPMHAGPARRWVVPLALAAALACGCARPPQLADHENRRAVDALWTAVCAKQSALVDQSAAHLDRLHAQGSLANDAHRSLSEIVELAGRQQWGPARDRLKTFIRAQRPTAAE